MAYKKETDYMALMNKAALSGDLERAAELEKQRNEKIDGEGLSYHKTYVYHQPSQGKTSEKSTAKKETEAPTPAYQTKYQKKKDKALDAALSVKEFSYDVKQDPLYAQYEKIYTRAAKLSGEDALGLASENTGGLASSYAVRAAAQAENAQMDKLTDKIPELYKLAYDQYLKEIDTKIKQFELAAKADDTAYNRMAEEKKQRSEQKEKDRAYALDAEAAAWKKAKEEAELMGIYNGNPTREASEALKNLEQKDKEAIQKELWDAVENGIYDESFSALLGVEDSVLSAIARAANNTQAEENTETLRDTAWEAIENGIYEDWFSDVLSLSPDSLQAMAKYYAAENQYNLERLNRTSTGTSAKKSGNGEPTYGEVMYAMVLSDDPYQVFMAYAPTLDQKDYNELYNEMRKLEKAKKTPTLDQLNENAKRNGTFFPITFSDELAKAQEELSYEEDIKQLEPLTPVEQDAYHRFFPFGF